MTVRDQNLVPIPYVIRAPLVIVNESNKIGESPELFTVFVIHERRLCGSAAQRVIDNYW